jgi:pyruvate formate lyase activating enzyme
VGTRMSVDAVMAEIEKDRLFYDESGGGVTFSGGEPLAQPDFLAALLTGCREQGIHTALDTTGYATPEIVARIAPLVDLFLYDLKLMDDRRHQTYTGVSNVGYSGQSASSGQNRTQGRHSLSADPADQ